MKRLTYLSLLFVLPILFSCESDEAKFARMKMEEEQREKNNEKINPEQYLSIDRNVSLEPKQKLFKFSHYSYKGNITNNAQFTSYRNVLVCFEFKDKDQNILDELCYKIKEVFSIGEKQTFQLNIEEPKNMDDIVNFDVIIKDAEVLKK